MEEFQQQLVECISWCSTRINARDPADCFRSEELAPPMLDIEVSECRLYGTQTILEQRETVRTLADKRANLLNFSEYKVAVSQMGLAGGRLLAYNPFNNLTDGAACSETDGFLDLCNCPPWDSWIFFVEEPGTQIHSGKNLWLPWETYLLSWVPPVFVDLVDAGIDVNPEGCILWATDIEEERVHRIPSVDPELIRKMTHVPSSFTRQLRAAGLLG